MSTELSTKNDLRSFIGSDKFKEQVALSLPQHLTPDRFARVALTAMTRTPKLLECTRESLLRCLMDCSSLGLEPNGRDAHLIPYGKDCTLIVDFKGLIALAKRSGDVRSWSAELVCENDSFSWQDGVVTHGIEWRKPRGAMQAVYSRVTLKDGSLEFEVMTKEECEAIRKRSRAGNSGPWVTDFTEMCRKTVIRRHSKRLTLSPEFADALERDDDKIEERHAKGREIPVARLEPINPGIPYSPPTAGPVVEQEDDWCDPDAPGAISGAKEGGRA
jgi:recombination protein RecT